MRVQPDAESGSAARRPRSRSEGGLEARHSDAEPGNAADGRLSPSGRVRLDSTRYPAINPRLQSRFLA